MSKQNVMANNILECPICRDLTDVVTDYSQGAVICRNCGLVLETSCIDDSQEWRNFGDSSSNAKADRDRVGAITRDLISGQVSGTSIAVGNGRLGRIQFMAMNDQSVDRTIGKAHNMVKDIMRAIPLSDAVYSRSCELLKFMDDSGKLRNRTSQAWILAIIYMACRQERAGRTIAELVRAAPVVKEAEVARNYWRLDKIIAGSTIRQSTASNGADTDTFVIRYCSRLGVQAAEKAAEYVAIQASRFGLAGTRTPNVLAAVSVFVVAQLLDLPNKPSLETMADVSQARLSVISQVYVSIRQPIIRLLPPEFEIKKIGGAGSLP